MHDINWWLMLAAFLCGLVLTPFFMIRRVTREVPVSTAVGRPATAARLVEPAAAAPAAKVVQEPKLAHEPYGVGSARAVAGRSAPSGWRIKGHEGSMLYHTPDSPDYNRVVHDVWFKDEDSARRAGFTHWRKGATGVAAAAAGGAATAKLVGHDYGAASTRAAAGSTAPSGWLIKGNEDSMLYHTPDSPDYDRIVHDIWFQDEESAQRAGFTHWRKGHVAGPYGAGSAKAAADGSGPAGWTIKGNEESMLYHTTDSPNYNRIVHDVWFKDEDSARRAGFTHWGKGGR